LSNGTKNNILSVEKLFTINKKHTHSRTKSGSRSSHCLAVQKKKKTKKWKQKGSVVLATKIRELNFICMDDMQLFWGQVNEYEVASRPIKGAKIRHIIH